MIDFQGQSSQFPFYFSTTGKEGCFWRGLASVHGIIFLLSIFFSLRRDFIFSMQVTRSSEEEMRRVFPSPPLTSRAIGN